MGWVLVHGALLIAMIQRLHGYDYGSKVTLYGSLEVFINHPIDHIVHYTRQPMETSVIQKDEYIAGNILIAMGSALFSVNKDGYGDCTCATSCIYWSGCINNTSSEPFRHIAGVAQLNSGKVLIISDRGNRCLRRLDRSTQIITAYAGQCNESYDDTLEDDQSDTPVDMDVVKFCAPGTLQYVRSLQQIVVLDTCKTTSNIYTINIINYKIYKIYSTNRTVTGFVYELARNTLTLLFHSDHGQLVEVNLNTKAEVSMTGNPQGGSGGDGKISTLNSLLHIDSPRQIALEKGLYIVSDSNRDSNTSDIYMFDAVNDKFASLCVDYQECNLIRPVAVAVIDDYLYIGESVAMKELYNRTYFYYYYHRTYRVGIRITENYRNPVVDPQCRHGCWTGDWFRWDFNMADFTTTQAPSSTTGPGRDNTTHNYVYWIISGVFVLAAGATTVAIVFIYRTGRMCFKKKNSGSLDQTMVSGNPYTRMSDI